MKSLKQSFLRGPSIIQVSGGCEVYTHAKLNFCPIGQEVLFELKNEELYFPQAPTLLSATIPSSEVAWFLGALVALLSRTDQDSAPSTTNTVLVVDLLLDFGELRREVRELECTPPTYPLCALLDSFVGSLLCTPRHTLSRGWAETFLAMPATEPGSLTMTQPEPQLWIDPTWLKEMLSFLSTQRPTLNTLYFLIGKPRSDNHGVSISLETDALSWCKEAYLQAPMFSTRGELAENILLSLQCVERVIVDIASLQKAVGSEGYTAPNQQGGTFYHFALHGACSAYLCLLVPEEARGSVQRVSFVTFTRLPRQAETLQHDKTTELSTGDLEADLEETTEATHERTLRVTPEE